MSKSSKGKVAYHDEHQTVYKDNDSTPSECLLEVEAVLKKHNVAGIITLGEDLGGGHVRTACSFLYDTTNTFIRQPDRKTIVLEVELDDPKLEEKLKFTQQLLRSHMFIGQHILARTERLIDQIEVAMFGRAEEERECDS